MNGSKLSIQSPVKGTVKRLEEVMDEAFSTGVLGKGLAILPESGEVRAPEDGMIAVFFPTSHAIGIKTDSGAEILIHIGMDTVKLEGKYFTPIAKEGDKVKKGQLLLKFDLQKIAVAGYSLLSPVIITNTADYLDVIPCDSGKVDYNSTIFTIL